MIHGSFTRTQMLSEVHAVPMALAHGTWLLTTVVGNERVVWGRFDRSVNDLMRWGSDTVLTYTSEQCRFDFLFRVALEPSVHPTTVIVLGSV